MTTTKTMTVGDLIARLHQLPPQATVWLQRTEPYTDETVIEPIQEVEPASWSPALVVLR